MRESRRAADDLRCRHPERRRAVAYALASEVTRAAVEGPSSIFLRVRDAQGVPSGQGQSAAVRLTTTRQPAFFEDTLSRSPKSIARAKWVLRLRLGKPLRLKITTWLASAQDDRAFRQEPDLATIKPTEESPVARTTCCPGARSAQEAMLVLPVVVRFRANPLASPCLRQPGQKVVRATKSPRGFAPNHLVPQFGPLHPERMEISQPRVARNELPWVRFPGEPTLKGLNPRGSIQPFQGWSCREHTQGRRCCANLGLSDCHPYRMAARTEPGRDGRKAGDEVQLRRLGAFPSTTWERGIRSVERFFS